MVAAAVEQPEDEFGQCRSERRVDWALGEHVAHAVRLGWYLAEVRGRAWWRGQRPAGESLPPDANRPLPLRMQRSVLESRAQAVDALTCLAEQLDVTGPDEQQDADASFAPRLRALLDALDDDASDRTWSPVAALMYEWDSSIQDQLTARADILACAYLLGRGLSECYWALAPEDDQLCADGTTASGGSWSFLFSAERRRELSRLAGRIGPYVKPLTPVAVSGSLEAWGSVAANPAWRREPTTSAALYEQIRRWYQLLVLGQDPSTLVKPSALMHGPRTTLRLARAFWPQLLGGVLSLAVVAAFLLLLTTGAGGPGLKTALALVGTIGLSASTLAAKAKNATQSLFARLRQSCNSDLVALEVTSVPPHPDDARQSDSQRRSTTHREIERAVATRTIGVPIGVL